LLKLMETPQLLAAAFASGLFPSGSSKFSMIRSKMEGPWRWNRLQVNDTPIALFYPQICKKHVRANRSRQSVMKLGRPPVAHVFATRGKSATANARPVRLIQIVMTAGPSHLKKPDRRPHGICCRLTRDQMLAVDTQCSQKFSAMAGSSSRSEKKKTRSSSARRRRRNRIKKTPP